MVDISSNNVEKSLKHILQTADVLKYLTGKTLDDCGASSHLHQGECFKTNPCLLSRIERHSGVRLTVERVGKNVGRRQRKLQRFKEEIQMKPSRRDQVVKLLQVPWEGSTYLTGQAHY